MCSIFLELSTSACARDVERMDAGEGPTAFPHAHLSRSQLFAHRSHSERMAANANARCGLACRTARVVVSAKGASWFTAFFAASSW